MTDDRPGFLAVDSGLVRQTMVEALFTAMDKRSEERPPEAVDDILRAEGLGFLGADETRLDQHLRHYGYLARVVEAELFEPARQAADWAEAMLTDAHARTRDWSQALMEVCDELSRSEPVGKPSPDDELARTWQVPGPGGHVRHYLARRTIEDVLLDREEPVAGDPAELKRPWLYGFFVRVCEEALPDRAVLDDPA